MHYRAEERRVETNSSDSVDWNSGSHLFPNHGMRSASSSFFYFLNSHGDVTYFADTNFTEEQIESYEYNPWGILLTSANKNNLLYTSREFDFDAGLQFNRMRYYNPSLGMFIYQDKILNFNKFNYAYNNPLNYYDPLGLLPPWIGGLIAGRMVVCSAAFVGCGAGCDYLKLTGTCTEAGWKDCLAGCARCFAECMTFRGGTKCEPVC